MNLALLLHIYQPPTQFGDILASICNQSYRKIIEILQRRSQAKITLNISGSLTEQLANYGFGDIIENIKVLAQKGQIELTGSAKYHPLLPKIPKREVERQIKLNDETNRHFFGQVYRPFGFFPPEMAYSKEVGDLIEELGFSWIILEEYAFDRGYGRVEADILYKRRDKNLRVFFRNRDLSVKIAFGHIRLVSQFLEIVPEAVKQRGFLILAMDGETFGHHQPGLEVFLDQLLADSKIQTWTLSEVAGQVKKIKEIEPLSSTWGMSDEDWMKGNIYPKWDIPGHPLHPLQWKLTNLVIDIVFRMEGKLRSGQLDPSFWSNWRKARQLLDQAINSDQYWWASHNPLWHFPMIVRSTALFEKVIDFLPVGFEKEKKMAKNLAYEIVQKGRKIWGEEIVDK